MALVTCPECGGRRVELVGDPGAWAGYREEDCEACKGTGVMEALDAALYLAGIVKSHGRLIEYERELLARYTELLNRAVSDLDQLALAHGFTLAEIDAKWEEVNPPDPIPF